VHELGLCLHFELEERAEEAVLRVVVVGRL